MKVEVHGNVARAVVIRWQMCVSSKMHNMLRYTYICRVSEN